MQPGVFWARHVPATALPVDWQDCVADDVAWLCQHPSLRTLELDLCGISGWPNLWPDMKDLVSVSLKLRKVDLSAFGVGPMPNLEKLSLDLLGCEFCATLCTWVVAVAPQLLGGLSLAVEADADHVAMVQTAVAAAPEVAPISLGLQCGGHVGCSQRVHALLQHGRRTYQRVWVDDDWKGLVLPLPPLRTAELFLPTLPWRTGARIITAPTVVTQYLRLGMMHQSTFRVLEQALLRCLAYPTPTEVHVEMRSNPRIACASVGKFLKRLWLNADWDITPG